MSARLLFLSFLMVPVVAEAWLGKGHEQVADIAWTQLKPEARKEVGEILKAGDRDFQPASDSEADVRAAFRKASTWADWIKDHTDGNYEDSIKAWNAMFEPGFDPDDKDRESKRCKRWHYFDVPIKFEGKKPGVDASNALSAMTAARYEFAILARETTKDRKTQCWWLYWLEHVIGDLHQPLHCVSSYEFDATGDAGGNLFKLGISYPDNPKKMENLHFFWDQGIENAVALETGQPSEIEAVSARWTAAYSPAESDLSEFSFAKWIANGAKLAETVVYVGLAKDGVPTDEYRAKQADVCKRQAVLAGYRLANEINRGLGLL